MLPQVWKIHCHCDTWCNCNVPEWIS